MYNQRLDNISDIIYIKVCRTTLQKKYSYVMDKIWRSISLEFWNIIFDRTWNTLFSKLKKITYNPDSTPLNKSIYNKVKDKIIKEII